jgi:DNA-binding CsgD family transcriptional regulator
MKTDIVGVIEAAYQVEQGSDRSWLAELLARARPSLDRGLGVAAYFMDLTQARYASPEPVGYGMPDGWREIFDAMVSPEAVTPAIRRRLADPTPVVTLSQNLGKRLFASIRDMARSVGFRDWLGIKVLDPTLRGIILSAPLPRVMRPTPATVALWSRIAGHLSAGYRLRRRFAVDTAATAAAAAAATDREGAHDTDWSREAEAILHPSGQKVLHAGGVARSREARESLLVAAQRMDRARGRLRRTDPEEAVAIWLGLVAGRWSLVDQVDRDGKRYLLAHRNDPQAPKRGARALTDRERQILAYATLGHANKLIAYELGLATSTVSELLARVRVKLGASSRNEMIALLRAATTPAPAASGAGATTAAAAAPAPRGKPR